MEEYDKELKNFKDYIKTQQKSGTVKGKYLLQCCDKMIDRDYIISYIDDFLKVNNNLYYHIISKKERTWKSLWSETENKYVETVKCPNC